MGGVFPVVGHKLCKGVFEIAGSKRIVRGLVWKEAREDVEIRRCQGYDFELYCPT